MTVQEYVSSFRARLQKACEVAKEHLVATQAKMKARYDQKSVSRTFQPGESVMVLLSVPGSALQTKFIGPYIVDRQLSETNFVVQTPDRRRKTRVCHVNMLKAYIARGESNPPKSAHVSTVDIGHPVTSSVYCPEQDGLEVKDAQTSCIRLQNSDILNSLELHLAHLSKEQWEDVVKLIAEHPILFSDVPQQTTVLTHDIDVGTAVPIKQHPYRVNPKKREVMRMEVEYLLQHGLAEPSKSPWSSPCLLVPKSDSSLRFCTDYRKVNDITKPDSFPLPRLEGCVDRVGSSQFVTKLVLLKGYWQVPLTARASEISAFVTPDNFLQYKVMAFGMRNAPATFQRLMREVLSGVTDCEAYLDDIVIYSSTWRDHIEKLNCVFDRLAAANLTLNLAKCDFAKAVVTYLGKKVGQGQVHPVEEKITAVVEFPIPTTKREMRRFLGMTSYYRRFCKNFASVVSPLTDLLSTSKKFVWTPECPL